MSLARGAAVRVAIVAALTACAGERPLAVPVPMPSAPPARSSPAIRVTPDESFRRQPPEDATDDTLLKHRYEAPAISVSKLTSGLPVEILSQAGPAFVRVSLALRDPLFPVVSAPDAATRRALAARSQVPRALIFGGARERPALELALLAEFATFTASEGAPWVEASVTAPASHFDQVAHLLAEITTRATFPEAQLATLKRDPDARTRIDPPDAAVAWRALPMALCGWDYPLSVDVGLRPEDLRAVTRKDVVREYEDLFDPSQATLIVTGKVEPDHVRAVLEKEFGAWRRRARPASPRAAVRASPARSPRLVIIDHPGASESSVAGAGLGPPLGSRDFPALLVMKELLGGSSGRLASSLRERRIDSWAPSTDVLDLGPAGASLFSWRLAVDTPRTAEALAAVDGQLRRAQVADEGSVSEVAEATRRRAATEPMWLRTLSSSTATLTQLATRGVDPNDVRTLSDRLLAVRPADVARVAKQTLDPQGTRVIVVGDWNSIRPDFARLGWGPVELRDARGKVLAVVTP